VAARICLQAQEQFRPERGISPSGNRPRVPTARRV
jgi:hypothetical protein